MAEEVNIKAEPRSIIGKHVKKLRREGGLPAVIYGAGVDPIPVVLNAHEASRQLAHITSSQLITVEVEGKKHNVLVRERQRHPVRGELLHIDFQVVSMTQKIRTTTAIILEGEAPALADGLLLVTGQETLEIEALPRDLPESISVDVSNLREVGDQILVRDIQAPKGVEILTAPDLLVVHITAPAAVPVEEELEEEAAAGEPEVIERGKREEEEEE